jgi:peroxiredoxin Q/BCP
MGAIVIGVSADDIETQKRFKEELELPFELLSDKDKEVIKSFGVLNAKGTGAQRKTFIIDPDGNIAYIFGKVNVNTHAEEVKAVLKKLQSGS